MSKPFVSLRAGALIQNLQVDPNENKQTQPLTLVSEWRLSKLTKLCHNGQ